MRHGRRFRPPGFARSIFLPMCATSSCSPMEMTPARRRRGTLRCVGRREGRRVRIARPPRGLDFNDVLLGPRTHWPVEGVAVTKETGETDRPSHRGALKKFANRSREGPAQKPRLLIENCNPDQTVAALRDILAAAGGLYDRGVPVRLAFDQIQRGTVAQVMTPDALVLSGAHAYADPTCSRRSRMAQLIEADARLPRSFAVMYLDWRGEWRLPPLNGIATAPLLKDDGTIKSTEGYDPASACGARTCRISPRSFLSDRRRMRPHAALRLIRETFKTFCFADAETIDDADGGVPVVDASKPPGRDESSFLVALLTAVCRPSLHLAPGVLLRAAPMSGAGAGKGLLARCICIIAFGREPHAVTAGATAEELEKRIAAELIEGSPALFLDNLNNTAFKSNLLASAITERPARVRLLGRVADGAFERFRLCDPDRQRVDRLGGPGPALHRGGFRSAHRGPRGAPVHDRYPRRGDGSAEGTVGRAADNLALGQDCDRH